MVTKTRYRMSLYPLRAKTWQQLVHAFVKYPAFHGTLLRHFRMDHLFLVVGQQDIFVLSSGSHPRIRDEKEQT